MRNKAFCIIIAAVIVFSQFIYVNADNNTQAVSSGMQNIVKRAYQMTDITWTPKDDIKGWNGKVTYKEGVTYTGLPYGQPVYASYVPWDASLDKFIIEVENPESKMYTDYSTYNKIAPYYSVDCSAFVSWAWGLPSRQTTRTIHNFADKISDSSYDKMEIGDALCKAGVHIVLVTDISYDQNGKISEVEISESAVKAESNNCCLKTEYGKDRNLSLDDFYSEYFENGYILYRYKYRDSVTYAHNCNVPLEGDVCSLCQPKTEPPSALAASGSDITEKEKEESCNPYIIAFSVFAGAVLISICLVSIKIFKKKKALQLENEEK